MWGRAVVSGETLAEPDTALISEATHRLVAGLFVVVARVGGLRIMRSVEF